MTYKAIDITDIFNKNRAKCQIISPIFFNLLMLMALAACGMDEDSSSGGTVDPDYTIPPLNQTAESYPGPQPSAGYPAPVQENLTQEAYPAPVQENLTQEAYPAPTVATGILLAFDKPIESNATVITGVGPPGLFVRIIDITFMGPELGAAVIPDDGSFEIAVSGLQPGTRIGLTADLENSLYSEDEVRSGSEAINIPRVGYFFDSYVLKQE